MGNLAIAIERIDYTRLFLEEVADSNKKKDALYVSGRMVLTADNKLKFGIQIKQQGNINVLVELYGYFETKDFNPEAMDEVAEARTLGFTYLFPFARSAFSSLFALGGRGIPNIPFILVDEVFNGVRLEREDG